MVPDPIHPTAPVLQMVYPTTPVLQMVYPTTPVLQMGIPGGVELLIVFVIYMFLPLAVVAVILYYLHSINRKLERLVELQE